MVVSPGPDRPASRILKPEARETTTKNPLSFG
jgi:hypothetical protein